MKINDLDEFLGGFWVEQVIPKPNPDFTGPGSGREVPDPKPERVGQQGPQPDPTLTDDKSRYLGGVKGETQHKSTT